MEDRSFVVRIDRIDGLPDFKVFGTLPGARERFKAATAYVWKNELRATFLFEVPDQADPRLAVEMVKAGKAILLDRDPVARLQRDIDAMIAEDFPKLHGDDPNA